ncbi:MAG: hypothetical protein WA869_10890 [Alloacidobacterium sp.]|jgi:hypothetical protein
MSFEQKNQQSPQQQTSNPQQTERSNQQAPEQQRPSHMNQGNPGFRPSSEKKEDKNPSEQHKQQDERSRKAS